MKKRSYLLVIALALLAIIAVIIIFQWRASVETPPVVVPSPTVSDEGSGSQNSNTPLEIKTDSVQEIIASIVRPNAYSRKYRVRRFWEGGEAEEEISTYLKGEQFLMIQTRGGRTKSTLFSSDKVHYWYDNAKPVVTVSITDSDSGTLDLAASLLVYERLLDISTDDILTATDEVYLDESCIFVEYQYSEKYVYRLHISVEKGLLVGAEVLEDGGTVYQLETISTDMSAPADDVFALPR